MRVQKFKYTEFWGLCLQFTNVLPFLIQVYTAPAEQGVGVWTARPDHLACPGCSLHTQVVGPIPDHQAGPLIREEALSSWVVKGTAYGVAPLVSEAGELGGAGAAGRPESQGGGWAVHISGGQAESRIPLCSSQAQSTGRSPSTLRRAGSLPRSRIQMLFSSGNPSQTHPEIVLRPGLVP